VDNEELHYLYLSPNIITMMIESKRMRWAGHVVHMVQIKNVSNILVGKDEGKRPLGRPTRRFKDNIKMYIKEIVWL
jgi:hypothetical protein